MNKKLIYVLSFILSVLLSFLTYNVLALNDPPSYIVAKSIPKYPQAENYQVKTPSGDVSPYGEISFSLNSEKAKNPESVFDFYKESLVREGWGVIDVKDSQEVVYLNKQIGTQNFRAQVRINNSTEVIVEVRHD